MVTKKKLNILVATDFSPESKHTFSMVERLAEAYDFSISLIHVMPSYWKLWFYAEDYKNEVIDRLRSFRERFLGGRDVKKILIKIGNPADNILQAAEAVRAKIIVVGDKKSSSSGRYRSGTVLKGIIRSAKDNVLICKPDRPIASIMAGVDGSEHSKKVLRWSVDLCRRLGARLDILSVLQMGDYSALGVSPKQLKAAQGKLKTELEQKINAVLERFDLSGLNIKRRVLSGQAADVLLDQAEDMGADLLVIGAKGHGRLYHVLLGSTAEKVSAFAPCSLLIVR